MDTKQAVALAKEYKAAISEQMDVKAIYLYGSFSKGTYRPDSDIDIAVIVDRLSTDYFEDTPILWRTRRKISNRIEPVLLTEDLSNPLYSDIIMTGTLI